MSEISMEFQSFEANLFVHIDLRKCEIVIFRKTILSKNLNVNSTRHYILEKSVIKWLLEMTFLSTL